MAHEPRKPAEKIQATKTPPPKLGTTSADDHDEGMIDEAVDSSFPASDPPAIASPSSTLAVKKVAQEGRDVDPAEPDPKKKKLKPTKR
jgi:hypothetical protein